jgi:signal transduction histidine kinase
MADSLVAALHRQRAFVADASHELRNPLATMRLRIESLAPNVSSSGQRDLRLALNESDRLAHTVNRMLELARAEATAAEQIEFDVVSVATERVDAWRPALASVGSIIWLNVPTQALTRCSPDAVRYALDVLLDNARKFAPGTEVHVSVAIDNGGVDLHVHDHGLGLTKAELAHASERFWRSPRHRRIPGTGLGLATTRALLEGAGATMNVRSADPGLIVRLRLPSANGQTGDTSVPLPDADPGDRRRLPREN